MNAEAYVRTVHPGAVCYDIGINVWVKPLWKVYDGTPAFVALSASFPMKADAWADAAKRLKERE